MAGCGQFFLFLLRFFFVLMLLHSLPHHDNVAAAILVWQHIVKCNAKRYHHILCNQIQQNNFPLFRVSCNGS